MTNANMRSSFASRLLMLVVVSSAASMITTARAQDVMGSTTGIKGAGSTFAFPLITEWSRQYRLVQQGAIDNFVEAKSGLDDPPSSSALDYEPVGSMAGLLRVKQGAVDFAASDVPLKSDELAKLGLVQFPIVIGGIAVVVNIDGIGPGQVKLTGPVLADIFLGKIMRWSDPVLSALNPELRFPDQRINIVRRSDGSGTTFNFTAYLSNASAEWRQKVGSDLLVAWPAGVGAKGNSGVSQVVKQTRNSIGYVEYGVAAQNSLAMAALQNRAGKFVKPEPASFNAAAAAATWATTADFRLLLSDSSGPDAYPLVATVYVLMPRAAAGQRAAPVLDFFQWSLDQGGNSATKLGYVPLPDSLVKSVKGHWSTAFGRRR